MAHINEGLEIDNDGNCPRHPFLRLSRYSHSMRSWIMLLDSCPLCQNDNGQEDVDDADDDVSSEEEITDCAEKKVAIIAVTAGSDNNGDDESSVVSRGSSLYDAESERRASATAEGTASPTSDITTKMHFQLPPTMLCPPPPPPFNRRGSCESDVSPLTIPHSLLPPPPPREDRRHNNSASLNGASAYYCGACSDSSWPPRVLEASSHSGYLETSNQSVDANPYVVANAVGEDSAHLVLRRDESIFEREHMQHNLSGLIPPPPPRRQLWSQTSAPPIFSEHRSSFCQPCDTYSEMPMGNAKNGFTSSIHSSSARSLPAPAGGMVQQPLSPSLPRRQRRSRASKQRLSSSFNSTPTTSSLSRQSERQQLSSSLTGLTAITEALEPSKSRGLEVFEASSNELETYEDHEEVDKNKLEELVERIRESYLPVTQNDSSPREAASQHSTQYKERDQPANAADVEKDKSLKGRQADDIDCSRRTTKEEVHEDTSHDITTITIDLEDLNNNNTCDSRGRCVRHPQNQLRKKKMFGGGWKVLMRVCPSCCTEEISRSMRRLEEDSGDKPVVTPRDVYRNERQNSMDTATTMCSSTRRLESIRVSRHVEADNSDEPRGSKNKSASRSRSIPRRRSSRSKSRPRYSRSSREILELDASKKSAGEWAKVPSRRSSALKTRPSRSKSRSRNAEECAKPRWRSKSRTRSKIAIMDTSKDEAMQSDKSMQQQRESIRSSRSQWSTSRLGQQFVRSRSGSRPRQNFSRAA